jgi:hypothetical protein
MSALLAPLLAQLVTVGVANRTEARYYTPSSYHAEGSTRPGARLTLAWPRYQLSFSYGAAFTLVPLESKPRDLIVFHSASVGNSYTYKRTTVTLSTTASWGEVNFRTQALGTTGITRSPGTPITGDGTTGGDPKPDPNKPTTPNAPSAPNMSGTVGPGAPGQLQTFVADGPVRYGTLSNALTVTHRPTKTLRLGAFASYTIAGGLNETARDLYPYVRGTTIGATGGHLYSFSARDSLATTITMTQAWSSLGNQVTSVLGTEGWNHRVNKRTSTVLSGGVSFTRTPFGDYSAYSVFPTFGAFINHNRPLARGTLILALGTFSAPALDPLRATVDPRVGLVGTAGWARDRFSARATGSAAVSVADSGNNEGAFNNFSAGAGVAYRLTKWAVADAGGSLAQQAFRDRTTIPLSYAAFVGLTFGVEAPIAGSKR